MNIVIGSGPSGVAVADALLAAGQPVLMLDAGLSLDEGRRVAKRHLAATDPAAWTPPDLAFLHEPSPEAGSVPAKRSFGSDFPYTSPPGAIPRAVQATGIDRSFAQGGLSTVWGSAMLAFRDKDITDWPISAADLRDGYARASRLLPLSAAHDDLDVAFPLTREPDGSLPLSRQAERCLTSLTRHRETLRGKGITFGRARLAVDAPACVRCGLCLHGCPHDLIYSAASTLDDLRRRGLAYRDKLVVRAVSERDAGIDVHALDSNGSGVTIAGSRVFLGAGVVNTTEIMLRSLNWVDRPVAIKDAQYFLMPVLQWGGTPDIERERLTTLCQLFVELDDAALSAHTIHLQLYGYNDIIHDMVRAKLGRLHKVVPLGSLLGRLMVIQGYLHSDHSGTIEATLRAGSDGESLRLVGQPNPGTAPLVSKVGKTLGRLAPSTKLSPISPLLDVTEPGRGFHSGGSFPMAREPRDDQTDVLGRPHGFSRLHLVDSSTFPSIPATTITFAVMANAHRIAAAAARGDAG